jgi:dephospho-CoA kinase
VGLTGGIGAGKSMVATGLAGRGAVVVDADRLAREVVQPGSDGLAAVIAAFGPGVLTADGILDRAALGQLVFADPAARGQLNALLHPRIAALTVQRFAAAPSDAVVVHDVPLLVENGMGAGYHLVLVVHAPLEERVRRLVRDRGMRPQDASARIAVQADDSMRRAAADVWLDNSGTPASLLASVGTLWRGRLIPFEANVRGHRPAPRPITAAVVAADPTWPEQAARLAARVAHAVRAAGQTSFRVDHYGSTAVPGLAAQDLLDLQLVLPDPALAQAACAALKDAGFVRSAADSWERPPAGSSRDPQVHRGADPGRAVTVQLQRAAGPSWREVLLFRDWLSAHPGESDAYTGVKRAGQGLELQAYSGVKLPWLTAAAMRARAWADAVGWVPGQPLAPG